MAIQFLNVNNISISIQFDEKFIGIFAKVKNENFQIFENIIDLKSDVPDNVLFGVINRIFYCNDCFNVFLDDKFSSETPICDKCTFMCDYLNYCSKNKKYKNVIFKCEICNTNRMKNTSTKCKECNQLICDNCFVKIKKMNKIDEIKCPYCRDCFQLEELIDSIND